MEEEGGTVFEFLFRAESLNDLPREVGKEELVLERSLMAAQSEHAQRRSIGMITSAEGLGSRFVINENP